MFSNMFLIATSRRKQKRELLKTENVKKNMFSHNIRSCTYVSGEKINVAHLRNKPTLARFNLQRMIDRFSQCINWISYFSTNGIFQVNFRN